MSIGIEVFFFFLLGSIFGSFANVLILRIPDERSIVTSSHCYSCKKRIRWFHNIPLISWLVLRGKCSYCKSRISPQYFVVELVMAVLFCLAFVHLGLCWYLLEILIFIFLAVTASFIDLKHYILPDVFTLGGIVIGLVGGLVNPERVFLDSLVGLVVGGGFLYLTAYIHFLIRKVEGMGGGDIKLIAWIGAVLGWQSLIFVIFVSGLIGALCGILMSVFFKKDLKDPIPFGPFLTFAALLFIFLDGHTIVQSVQSLFANS